MVNEAGAALGLTPGQARNAVQYLLARKELRRCDDAPWYLEVAP